MLFACLAVGCFLLISSCSGDGEDSGDRLSNTLSEKMADAALEAGMDDEQLQFLASIKKYTLTEEKLLSFIETIQAMRQKPGKEALFRFTQKERKSSPEVVQAIREAGWEPEEFYWIYHKIAGIWTFVGAQSTAVSSLQGAADMYEKMLQDPNVPESQKEYIKEQMEEAKQKKKELQGKEAQEGFEASEKAIGQVFYKKMATPEEVELIRKHKEDIEKVAELLRPAIY